MIIEAIVLAWKAASWGIRIAVVVGPLLVLGTAYGVWHHKVYRAGYVRAISDIAAQDERAIKQAETARGAWKECRDSGRRWDQVEGKCT